MQLKVVDGAGVTQTLVSPGLEAPADHSATIVATGVSQTLLAANATRSGWAAQNISSHTLYWNDTGVAGVGAGSFQAPAGGFFPPAGYPLSTGAINITGTIGDAFTVKEW